MRFPLKKTQTLTGSSISTRSNITRIKYESQGVNLKLGALFLVFSFQFLVASPSEAIVDPLSSPNNRFGIHIISAIRDEVSPAARLVNSGGDWGYVTVLVESRDRDHNKWQSFFDDLRRRHLIPIVRIATAPQGAVWKLPDEGEEVAWADFLNGLNWPTKNRYVVIYNEPNQSQEWAGRVDAASYAKTLDQTIDALKSKNPDFFVLNGGFDASAPEQPPFFQDEMSFLKEMEAAVPGIFNKLDGWVSHSYPNPGFAGSPEASGKGTVRTWAWELGQLQSLGVSKSLPVFITETGWKHAEGLNFDKSLPSAETVAHNLEQAFRTAWNDAQIVAVTPFVLNYQQTPFDHFSFKKLPEKLQDVYYPAYQVMAELPKTVGRPVQEDRAALVKGEVYHSIVAGESYIIPLTLKNTGQSIWGESGRVELRAVEGQTELGIQPVPLPEGVKIEPGKEMIFNISLKAPQSGAFLVKLQLFSGGKPFDQNPWEFTTEVKSPVILSVSAALPWKNDFSGEYLLTIASGFLYTVTKIELNAAGYSGPVEARYLLPDYTFDFTLQKPFYNNGVVAGFAYNNGVVKGFAYQPKTIQARVISGENKLDFGMLDPDFFAALFNPRELWKLLPFSH